MVHLQLVLQLLEEKNHIKKSLFRKGSSVGDYVGVTGFIGDAYIGLKILEKNKLFNLKTKKSCN